MTKSELKDIIMECLQEKTAEESVVEGFDMDFDAVYTESAELIPLDEAKVFISKQGKDIKEQIKTIVYENTTRLGGLDWIKGKLFSPAKGINPNEAEKVTAGLNKIFDCCAGTRVYSFSKDMNKKDYIAIKGNYLYFFTINFGRTKSGMAGLSFSERIIDNKSFNNGSALKPVFEFVIKNMKPDFFCHVFKSGMEIYKIGTTAYEPNVIDNKLYEAVTKKFGNLCYYDDATGKLRFKIGSQL